MPIFNAPNITAVLRAIADSKAETLAEIAAKGAVKSIQRGESAFGSLNLLNVAISAVNMAKAVVIMTNRTSNTSIVSALATASLTAADNLEIKRQGSVADCFVSWQVIEYE